MTSIRTYEGEIFLCGSCGQPAYKGGVDDPDGHFREQWDGIYCPRFPLAGELISIKWDRSSLEGLKKKYPDTHP